jgi:hypothetical protein
MQKEVKEYHALIAAFIGGYLVFGEKNNVNEQVCQLDIRTKLRISGLLAPFYTIGSNFTTTIRWLEPNCVS